MSAMAALKELTPKIVEILLKNGVAKAGIFGSYARGEETPKSDLDILVEFKGRKSLLDLVGLEQDLEDQLKRKFDVMTYGSLSPYLKEGILREEVRIL